MAVMALLSVIYTKGGKGTVYSEFRPFEGESLQRV